MMHSYQPVNMAFFASSSCSPLVKSVLVPSLRISNLNIQISILNIQISILNIQISILNIQISNLNIHIRNFNIQISILNIQLKKENSVAAPRCRTS